MVNPVRLLKHLLTPAWVVRLRFDTTALRQITQAIAAAESMHAGEIRFAVEASLPLSDLLAGRNASERAIEVFSNLHIWDTEHNNGVLIYLLLADRNVEIVADRGIYRKVNAQQWENIAQAMEQHCRNGDFVTAIVSGISAISHLLAQHYPAKDGNPNELPDEPVLLK